MNRFIQAMAIAGLVGATNPLLAADSDQGKALHQEHCGRCHDDGVYTRKDRRVKDMAGLTRQVKRCEQSLGLTWFDEDINNVVTYLNESYYQFK